jgi:hypothetical protein
VSVLYVFLCTDVRAVPPPCLEGHRQPPKDTILRDGLWPPSDDIVRHDIEIPQATHLSATPARFALKYGHFRTFQYRRENRFRDDLPNLAWLDDAGNAAAYERLVQEEVFAIIAEKKIAGCRGIDLLRRRAGDEVEFVTIMRFDSLANVKAFVDEDYERSFVPPQARAVLKRFDDRSQHYEHIRHIDYADAQG